MFLQDRFYLVNGLRVLLQKDLIGDGGGEHVAGNVPRNGGAGKGHDDVSTTVSEPIKVAIGSF